MPIFFSIASLFLTGMSICTPRASSTSAAPHLLVEARLPCFATGTPAAEATRAETVEILKELALSPPVPTISSTSWSFSSFTQWFRMPLAQAVISCMVSPFMERAMRKALICTGVAWPLMISSMDCSAIS